MVHGIVSRVKSFFTKKTTTTSSPTGGQSTPSGPVLVIPSGEVVGTASIGGGGGGSGGGGGGSSGGTTISGTTSTERELKMSLPADIRTKSVAEVRGALTIAKQVASKGREPVPTLGERREEALMEIQKKELKNILSSTGSQVESRFQDLGSFEEQQFRIFQGRINRGELSLEEAQSGFQFSILGERKKLQDELSSIGGFISTPQGVQFSIVPTEAELKSSREKAIKEVGTFKEFTERLPAREFFPSALSSIGFSALKLGGEVSGAGAFVKEFSFGGRPSISRSVEAFKKAEKEAGIILKTEGRQGDIFGSVATTGLLFGAPIAKSIGSGIKGGKTFVSAVREKGFKSAITPRAGLGTDIALGLSLVQPVRTTLPTVTTKTLSAIKEVKKGDVILREVAGGFEGTGVTFKQGQVLIKTPESTSGLSITKTTTPKFKSNLGEIFGGDVTQFSFGIQTTPATELGLQRLLSSEKGLSVFKSSDILKLKETKQFEFPIGQIISKRKGGFTFQEGESLDKLISKRRLGDFFSRTLGTSAKVREGEGVIDFVGVGGKGISDLPVAKQRDIFFGRRILIPEEEGSAIILKSPKIKRTPFEKTFTDLKVGFKEEPRPTKTPQFKPLLKEESAQESIVGLTRPRVSGLKLKQKKISIGRGSSSLEGIGLLTRSRDFQGISQALKGIQRPRDFQRIGQSFSFAQAQPQRIREELSIRSKLAEDFLVPPSEGFNFGFGVSPFRSPFVFLPFKSIGLSRSKKKKRKGRGLKPRISTSFTGVITGGRGLPRSTIIKGIDVGILPGQLRGKRR